MADTLLDLGSVTDATVQPGGEKPDFRIYTGSIYPQYQEGDRDQSLAIVRMVGSSNVTDLQGDTMLLSALTDMTRVEAGLSIWLNHRYDVPVDMFGSLTKSPEIFIAEGIADVVLEVDTELKNPPAALTYDMIKSGKRRLGCSIGCIVDEYDVAGAGSDGYQPIDVIHLRTLEYSVVGIPCNQRSWVENAVKGIFERTLDHRLAAAVKGLFPKAFEEFVEKNVRDKELKEYFVKCSPRPAENRIYWDPMRKAFSLYSPSGRGVVTNADVKKMVGQVQDQRELLPIADGHTVELEKSASGSTSWPLADREKAWDAAAAHARIFGWARGDKGPGEFDASKAKSVHFWFDSAAPEKMGSYKLPFCDIVGGSPVAIPRGIFAVAGALGGSRGGLSIPDSDVSGVRSKVSAYYSKMRSKFSDDSLVPPWEKKDSVEEVEGKEVVALMKDKQTGLNVIEVEGVTYAQTEEGFVPLERAVAPAKPIDQVTIGSDGNHEKTVGTHAHAHKSYGYTKAADGSDDMHKHKHTHGGGDDGKTPDNDHKHPDDHASQGFKPGDGDGGDGDGQKAFSIPFQRQVESFRLLGKTVGTELTRKAVDMQAVVTLASYIDNCADVLGKEIDQLLITLGIPDYDDDDPGDPRTTYGMVSTLVKAIITRKEGRKLGRDTMKALQGIHDTLKEMTDGMVCSGQLPNQPAPGGSGSSLEDARATADAASGRDPYSGLLQDMADLSAGLKKSSASTSSLADFQKQLDVLKLEVGKYIDSPQGRPTSGNASLKTAPGSATATSADQSDFSRKQRPDGAWVNVWPKGFSPKGGRPPLTTDEMSIMSNHQIMSYINGDEAEVPDVSGF